MSHTTIDYLPVFTVAEARELRGTLRGGNSKCLFLKNKKQQMWLLVLPEDLRLDLDRSAAALSSRRLSFGSPDRLLQFLGVTPGAVSPFAVINDQPACVTVVVAEELLRHEILNFHPLVNDRTTSIATADLIRFLEITGHPPVIIRAAEIGAVDA